MGLILSACQSMNADKPVALERILSSATTISLPIEQGEGGLIYLTVVRSDKSGRFILDTGATRSAIFKDSRLVSEENRHNVGVANIFGLAESGTYPLIKTENLRLGDVILDDLALAYLPANDDHTKLKIDGILGMDFLGQYQLLIKADENRIYLIDENTAEPDITRQWTPVQLFGNPFLETETRLHFFNLRVGSHIIPALLDTGSEINLINWNATNIPELKRMRRRLFEDWSLSGAVGEFKPRARVNVKHLRAGQMRWEAHQFIVLDFDHLDSMGFSDEPMVIGGYPLLAGRNVYFDFAHNMMWIEPVSEPDADN